MALDLTRTMASLEPGIRPFYKYVSPDTACTILQNKTVRYSSPLTFNDPFDVQAGLHFDFNLNSLQAKIIEGLEKLASQATEPEVDSNDVWGQIVLKVRELYPRHGFPKEKWLHTFKPVFDQIAEIFEETRSKYQAHWQNNLLPGARVFCVTEDRDNLLMWAHYAKEHTGAVFEFWSLPDEDNPLSVARQVQYRSEPPPFFSEAEFIDNLLSVRKLDFDSLYRQYAYFKSSHWAYEREWRVWYPLSKSELHDLMPVRPSEFRALYLGCRTSDKDRDRIKNLAENSFPDVKIYQAHKQDHTYELSYSEV
jgi:hypothetical protein